MSESYVPDSDMMAHTADDQEAKAMNNLEKINEMLKDNPELKQKITEEAKRLAESKEAGNAKETIAKAIKSVLGIELTPEELDAMFESPGKMNLDDLNAVAGGFDVDSLLKPVTGWITDIKNIINPAPPSVINSCDPYNAEPDNPVSQENEPQNKGHFRIKIKNPFK